MKKLNLLFVLFLGVLVLNSCKKDDTPETGNLNLAFSGLEDLGSDYAYEGWLMVDGSPISAGIFNVDANGDLSQSSFEIGLSDLDAATAYILTIEPSPDSDPSPSATHVLAGDFSSNSASLTVKHEAAIGTDFSSATGGYIIATPTDNDMTNENSGVWFVDPTAGAASLNLPTLPAGWAYEGWAVIDGSPVSTGTFLSATGSDDNAKFSGTDNAAPGFPGEDFLMAAPSGLTFPTDLAGQTIVVSVEPSPDNSANPFALKPLVGPVPATVVNGTVYDMDLNLGSNPTGTATR